MREVTGPFLIGSFQLPVKVHAFFASHVPWLTIIPVDMLSIHVLQCLPVTLSYPLMPWPVNGMPIIEPLNSSTSTRPSSAMLRVTVPFSSMGGAPDACQLFEFTSYVPTVDRKSTRLNSSHGYISYAVFCLKKKTNSYSGKLS